MDYFDKYRSNTVAGSGNQFYFLNKNVTEIHSGRIFYKILKGGKFNYSLLFSNVIDSTYEGGGVSHMNLICDSWQIERLSAGSCATCDCENMSDIKNFVPFTFNDSFQKKVMPGEFFTTDALELNIGEGEYLCIEIEFSGRMIPNHQESLLPTFIREGGKWVPSKQMPFPSMVGCDRKSDLKISFFGDSITQGIGPASNSYAHWSARLSMMLGNRYSYWNLGLGFGRADDAASDGAWLFKARQSDVVMVCFGVNDILQNFSEEQIKYNLRIIVKNLKENNQLVVIQTVPPFDYEGNKITIWKNVNQYILNEISKECDLVFDVVPILSKDSSCTHMAKYGGHPDAEGCNAWAKALFPVMKDFLENIRK